MDPEERAEIVLEKLRAQIEYAWERSPFYRRRWEASGVSPEALRTLDDLARFPLITKDDLRRDQEEHQPLGSNLCCSLDEIGRLLGTSGTTG